MKRPLFLALTLVPAALFAATPADGGCPVSQNLRGHENIEWSIGYAFHLTDANKALPRVLLVGDSICNGYQSGVIALGEGKVNVSYWVSSYCVTSPGYLKLLGFYLDEAKYDVIHFNNGLHSLGTNLAAYEQGLRAALRLIREKQPQARLVWASSTPLRDAAKTAVVRRLNDTAAKVVAELGGIATDDLFALLDPLDRAANWSDVFHHKPNVRTFTAEAVYKSVRASLASPKTLAAERFGALYEVGEAATFAADAEGATWLVLDAYGKTCAQGVVSGGVVRVASDALQNRLGAYVLRVGAKEAGFAYLLSKDTAPCAWIGTGTHGGHGWGRGDYRYLDLIRAAGIGVVRDDVHWAACERKKGVYSFDPHLTNLVEGLVARGIRFRPILNGSNPIYADPLDADAYAAFCAAFAKTFKGKIDTVEIFNEPHNFNFPKVYLPKGGKFRDWQCRADAPWIPKHALCTRKAVAAIKAVEPAFDVGVGVEDYWDFFKVMLRQDLVRADDLVTIHPYDHEHYPPEGNWFFRDGGREVRAYLKAHGGATRIAMTECGWTTYDATKDPAHAYVGNYPASTLEQQARYLVRFYVLARQHGIEYACQYDFQDDGPKRHYTEDNFGLVRQDDTPKPSFAAVATLARLVGDKAPCGEQGGKPAKARLYAFGPAEKRVFVAWSLAGNATLDLPADLAARLRSARDFQGNPIALPVAGNRLALTENPIYLFE